MHNDCSFRQYKFYADIRLQWFASEMTYCVSGGPLNSTHSHLETRRQTTVGWSKTSIFRAFGRYVFGTLGNEAIIIT